MDKSTKELVERALSVWLKQNSIPAPKTTSPAFAFVETLMENLKGKEFRRALKYILDTEPPTLPKPGHPMNGRVYPVDKDYNAKYDAIDKRTDESCAAALKSVNEKLEQLEKACRRNRGEDVYSIFREHNRTRNTWAPADSIVSPQETLTAGYHDSGCKCGNSECAGEIVIPADNNDSGEPTLEERVRCLEDHEGTNRELLMDLEREFREIVREEIKATSVMSVLSATPSGKYRREAPFVLVPNNGGK